MPDFWDSTRPMRLGLSAIPVLGANLAAAGTLYLSLPDEEEGAHRGLDKHAEPALLVDRNPGHNRRRARQVAMPGNRKLLQTHQATSRPRGRPAREDAIPCNVNSSRAARLRCRRGPAAR